MISIIIPIYNQSEHLANCLASIKKQTYDNYEIIIVNDGSTDNILPVIQKRAMKKANDGRKVIVSISNGYVNAIREHVEAESDWDNEADAGNGPAQEPDPDAEEDTSPNPSAMTDDGESGTEIAMGDGVPWAE